MITDTYEIYDTRTGRVACSGVWSERLALSQIESFRERQRRGGRPDISAEDVASLAIRPWQQENQCR